MLTGALAEPQKLNQTGNGSRSWLKKNEEIISENNLNVTSYGYKLKYKTFPENLLPHKGLRKVVKSKLKTKFKEEWDVKTSNMSKLSFYRKYKSDHYKIEGYITLVHNRRHRSALAKLRCNAHRLKIEIGRYIKVYNEHTTRHEQLPRKKRICDIRKGKVENEQHFILECKLNENLRQDLFSKLEIKPIQLWNEIEKNKIFFRNSKRI